MSNYDLLLPSQPSEREEETGHQSLPVEAVDDRWKLDAHDATEDIDSLPVSYSTDDFTESIVSLQRMIEERKQLRSRVDVSFREELPKYLKLSITAAPELLDMADTLDDVVLTSAAEGRKHLSLPKQSGKRGMEVLQLDRRRKNLKSVMELLEMVEMWSSKTRTVNEYLDHCEFATAATMLGVRLSHGSLLGRPNLLSNGSAVGGLPGPDGPNGPSASPPREATAGTTTSSSAHTTPNPHAPLVKEGSTRVFSEEDDQMNFATWSQAVGPHITPLVVGEAALKEWHGLSTGGVAVLTSRLRALLSRQFTPENFSKQETLWLLKGLAAMDVKEDSVVYFVLDGYQEHLDAALCAALTDVIGEQTLTWETTADILRPSELELCSVSFLRTLATNMQTAHRLQQYFTELQRASYDESNESRLSIPEGLLCFADKAAQKNFAALLAFTTRAQITRLSLDEMLRIYALFGVFLEGCLRISADGAAESAKTALTYQCGRAVSHHFLSTAIDAVMQLMTNEGFFAFPVGRDDYPELNPYSYNPGAEAMTKNLMQFLLATHQENPFSIHHRSKCAAAVIAYSDQEQALHMFEVPPIFTSTSNMVCKRMIGFARGARYFPLVAAKTMECAIDVCSVYVWFIVTHFVASREQQPLDEEQGVPHDQRSIARRLKERATKVGPPEYPLLIGGMCNSWKQHAGIAATFFAAPERSTALCSLEGVTHCLELCLLAIKALLSKNDCKQFEREVTQLATFSQYCIGSGLRQLTLSILNVETNVIQGIDRARWDGPQQSFPCQGKDGESSPFVKPLLAQIRECHERVKDMFRDLPGGVLHWTMRVMVFNVLVAIPEACSRLNPRRFNEWGKLQLLADVIALTRKIKDNFPLTGANLIEYAVRYVMTMVHPQDAVQGFVVECHQNYTSRQLYALADHEGPHRRKDVEAVLRNDSHEDRLPYHLLAE